MKSAIKADEVEMGIQPLININPAGLLRPGRDIDYN